MCGKDAPMWILLTRWLMNNGYESCQWCGTTEDLTFDHIVPYSYSGKRELGNLAILCNDCNVKKNNNYYSLDPCPWPNPAFPQILVKDLTAGMVTVYGEVTKTTRVTTNSGKTIINIEFTGKSILGLMRKREITNLVRNPEDVIFLDPRYCMV
jgi:hypothetical protein